MSNWHSQLFSAERLRLALQMESTIRLTSKRKVVWSVTPEEIRRMKGVNKLECLFQDAFKIARDYTDLKIEKAV